MSQKTEATKFAKGQTVQLKSGGPCITVEDPKGYGGTVECVWFAGAKREQAAFDPETLVPWEHSKKEQK